MNKQQKQRNTHKPSFPLTTHVRDAKGNIAREDHYRLTIEKGIKKFERPPGSGMFYDEQGNLMSGSKQAKPSAKPEFKNDDLASQIESLKAQLQLKDEKIAELTSDENQLAEIKITAAEVTIDDIPSIPASQADNSEEIALMKQAGVDTAEVEAKSGFVKPNFLGGN